MIRNHVCVVKLDRNTFDYFSHCTTIVWPGILRIVMFSIYGGFYELLGIMLATLSIDHARSCRVTGSTGTMEHAVSDCMV